MTQSLPLSPFRSVPPEILKLILEYLDRKELLSSRLICKGTCHCATPLAFKCLHMWFEEQSLQRLINIARAPHLRACVKILTFGLDAFYDISYEQFQQSMCPDFFSMYSQGFSLFNPAGIKYREAAWPVYQEYYQLQRALEDSGRGSAMMVEALGAFSSLCAIEFVDFEWRGGYSWNGWGEENKFLKKEKRLPHHVLAFPTNSIPVPRGGQQLRVLMKALAGTEKKLEKLSLNLWASNTGTGGSCSPLSTNDRRLAVAAFAGLKRLHLDLEPIRTYSEELSLTTIIRAATGLEYLDLQLPPSGLGALPGAHWRNIIQIQEFGCLKTLHIFGAILNESEFVAFLRQSCQKLRKLSLRHTRVFEDSWELTLKTIRGLKELQVIELDNLWYRCNRHEPVMVHSLNLSPVYDYLYQRTSDNSWRSCPDARE